MGDSRDATFAFARTGFCRNRFFNFSIKRNIKEKNLKAESFIVQRRICDFVYSVGGLFDVNIDKPILKVASSTYSRHIHLQKLKKTKEDNQLERKCKYLNEDLVSLKHKKQCFESDIKSPEKVADNLAERPEKELRITSIVKSNCLRSSVKKKKKRKKELEEAIVSGTGETLILANLSTLFNKVQPPPEKRKRFLSQEPSFLTTPFPPSLPPF